MFNEDQYKNSLKYLKNLNGLENTHENYSVKYLYSLVNTGQFKEAFNYSKKLEKKKLDSFESNLVIGVFYLKNSNLELAKKYFSKAKNQNSRFVLNKYVFCRNNFSYKL